MSLPPESLLTAEYDDLVGVTTSNWWFNKLLRLVTVPSLVSCERSEPPRGVAADQGFGSVRAAYGDERQTGDNTMQRRKLLAGLGSLAAGGAATIGSGAVSQFNSGDRTIEVETVGDASAYIALQRPESGLSDDGGTRNGNFVEYNGDALELDFTSNNPTSSRSGDPEEGNSLGGNGVNPGSTYYFDGTFELRNLSNNSGGGVGEIEIWINEDIPGVSFYTGSSAGSRTELNSSNRGSLSPGQALGVGVKIDQDDLDSDNIDGTFQVVAQENGNGL